MPLQQFGQEVFMDRNSPALQGCELRLIVVYQNYVVPELSKTRTGY